MMVYRIDIDAGAHRSRPHRPGQARPNHWTLSPRPGRARLARGLAAALAAVCGFDAAIAQPSDTTVLPIGRIQGDANGLLEDGFPSPLAGEVVTVQGVVYLPLIRYGRQGVLEYGFFIQNTPETADGDPNTSDGILVYMQRKQRVQTDSGDEYIPRIGDEIVIRGKIREIMNLTHLTAPRVVQVVRRGVDVKEALTPLLPSPPSEPAANARYWESLESMRATVPAGCIVQGGRKTFSEYHDAVAYMILPDSVPARRSDPYSRRVFRDAHPLDDNTESRFDNDNAYRVQVASLGIKGSTGDPRAIMGPLRTFDVTTEPVAAAVYQRYADYTLQVERDPPVRPGPMPTAAMPTPLPRDSHITIASFNVENLYDFRDDPADPCDFDGNPGNERVSPPFDYVPADDAAYHTKLNELAQQIVNGLRAPDLLMVQELEDQDMLTMGDSLAAEGADGRLDVMQELAVAIQEAGGPVYHVAADRDGADPRGITCGFFYRADRVEALPVDTAPFIFGPDLSLAYPGVPVPSNQDASNPKAINAVLPIDTDLSSGVSGSNVFARAAQVGLFRFRPASSDAETALDVYVINNHFSSRPDQRVGQRKEQARLNAVIAKRILAADPDAAIVVGGDLNVYPRPDDPYPDNPSDQLSALYEAGLANVYDRLLRDNPATAYTYVYRGQAGTIDQLFLSPAMYDRLAQAWIGHFNSDWPNDWPDDTPYGASDHDPVLASFRVTRD